MCHCGVFVVGVWCPCLLVAGAGWAGVWHVCGVRLCGRRSAVWGLWLVGDVRRAGGRRAGAVGVCWCDRIGAGPGRCGDVGVVRGCGVRGTSTRT